MTYKLINFVIVDLANCSTHKATLAFILSLRPRHFSIELLHQPLREISASLVVKHSTMFTVSVGFMVLGRGFIIAITSRNVSMSKLLSWSKTKTVNHKKLKPCSTEGNCRVGYYSSVS